MEFLPELRCFFVLNAFSYRQFPWLFPVDKGSVFTEKKHPFDFHAGNVQMILTDATGSSAIRPIETWLLLS